MKFECHKCKKETTFNLYDYVGSGRNQQKEKLIEMITIRIPKEKEIIVKCSNPDCKEPNILVVSYYE